MAQAELRDGRNEQLRRLAQEVIVEQQQQIAAMLPALASRNDGATERAAPPKARAYTSHLKKAPCSAGSGA